ncbi:MAG: hypothetical protein LBE62_08145 [Azonexus sp.]|jgi:tRNA A-37 threonylcarbamoyl transferase component Bud32|nr:hypothetical protein [Azonexus sp.]
MTAPEVSAETLRQAGRAPALPFALALPTGGKLEFIRLLRLLPGKRLTGYALCDGQPVLAKLFIGEAARRRGQREGDGLAALSAAQLPTPTLRFAGAVGDDAYLVLCEFLDGATTLDQDTLSPLDPEPLLPVMALLGRLHAAGLTQRDPHPGNFLRHRGKVLLIDGDGIRPAASAATRMINLAALLAQLTPDWDAHRQRLLEAYGRAVDAAALEPLVAAARQRRLAHFLRKTVRDCSQFAVNQTFRRFTAVLRGALPDLQPVLHDLDAAMTAGKLLKAGNTCTVAAVDIGDRTIVIKRYNLKHWRHALSRLWRPSRAWHSWRAAHRLEYYGIATPRPLALIEERCGPLRRRAFLITEHCPGPNLLTALDPGAAPPPAIQHALRHLFATLCRFHTTHGDLKATNLLWHDGKILLIDLDALTTHCSPSTFTRAWQRDRARLMRNWPLESALARWLREALPG